MRDLLLELSEAMGAIASARFEMAAQEKRDGGLPGGHPAVAAVHSVSDRLVIIAAAVEDPELRSLIDQLTDRAHMEAVAPASELTEQLRARSLEIHREAVQLLGERLRRLA